MSDTRIVYKPRPDATPETEAAALAAVYRFILDFHAREMVAEANSENDSKSMDTKGGEPCRASQSINGQKLSIND